MDNLIMLQQQREQKMKMLGMLGYNMYINKKFSFDGAEDLANAIRFQMGNQAQADAKQELEKNLTMMGFYCFNFCQDGKIDIEEMKLLYSEIVALNQEIENAKAVPAPQMAAEAPITEQATAEAPVTEQLTAEAPVTQQLTAEAPVTEQVAAEAPITEQVTAEQHEPLVLADDFREMPDTVPTPQEQQMPEINLDMFEMIPVGFRECQCSYKNRGMAFFCANCGKNLN